MDFWMYRVTIHYGGAIDVEFFGAHLCGNEDPVHEVAVCQEKVGWHMQFVRCTK